MRLVADSPEDYLALTLLQKQVTQLFKKEKGTGSGLETTYKKFIGCSVEKSYERPGQSVQNVNQTATMDTSDPELVIPYIVHGAVNRKKIALEYRDAKGNVSKRVIEPFTWRNGQVSAWCHERGAWRQFKPTQIIRVAVLSEDFERPEDVEIKATDAKEMAHLING